MIRWQSSSLGRYPCGILSFVPHHIRMHMTFIRPRVVLTWILCSSDFSVGKGYFFKRFIYLFTFRERGREGEREGEKHQSLVASQACALIGNRTCDPLVHRLELNPLSHTSQPGQNHLPSVINKQSL